MPNISPCNECNSYKEQGHNYCRVCGFHLTKGSVQNARHPIAYGANERFCGYCGGEKRKCQCEPPRKV